ncbi:SusC/RagA family TonB-linked outer membrane protein [Flavisolibacter sp. BT320]|nr:SusC/RagA family TonB-linked outer membrane protein [Flavisolibacter longurius]
MYYQLKRRLLVLLLVIFGCLQSWAQSKTVTGVVRGENNELLSGVSVSIKGTNRSTTTNEKGEFSILVAPESVVRFTFVGYSFQEILVGDKTNMIVTLSSINTKLDDVVIVGYGTQRARNVTGSVVAVSPRKLEELPVASISEMLRGQVPGLNVTGGSTRPGEMAQVSIRQQFNWGKDGGGTIPLIVIDDVVQIDPATNLPTLDAFNRLDLSEVESITVLRDASAAIYGTRASQGAIVVKTKRGKIGAPTISYAGKFQTNDAISHSKVMNAEEYGIFSNRLQRGLGSTNANNFFSTEELAAMAKLNYDWLANDWRSANSMQHSLNVSGGSDRATYFAGGSYYRQGANLGSQDFNRWTFRSGTDVKVMNSVKLSIILSAASTNVEKSFTKINFSDGYANGGEQNDYSVLLHMPRYIPWEYTINGVTSYVSPVLGPNKTGQPRGNNSLSNWNYYALLNNGSFTSNKNFNYTGNFSLQYDLPFVKGLSVRGNYAITNTSGNTEQVQMPITFYQGTNLATANNHLYSPTTTWSRFVNTNNSRVTYDNTTSSLEQINFFLNYDRGFGDHNISAMLSGEQSKVTNEDRYQIYENPVPGVYNGTSVSAGTLNASNTITYRQIGGTQSFLGRANYSYKNRYLASFLFRSDASSKFAPENYWGFFPSLSLGWIVSDESFFKNVTWINFLKLRASVGKTGNDNVKAWKWLQLYQLALDKGMAFGTSGGNYTYGITPDPTPYRDIRWDKTIQRNIGIDFSILNSRLSVNLDGYYNSSTDMLTLMTGTTNVPISVGGAFAEQNYAAVNFWGSEISATWNDRIGRDFNYSVGMNFGWSNNKVVKYLDQPFDYPSTFAGKRVEGYSLIGAQWGYRTWKGTSAGDGILRTDADLDAYWAYLTDLASKAGTTPLYNAGDANISTRAGMRKGMMAYEDIAGDRNSNARTIGGQNGQIIDDQDYVELVKRNQSYGIATNLSANWKSITLMAQVQTSWGGWNSIDRVKQGTSSTNAGWAQVAYLTDMYDEIDNPNGKYPNMAFYDAAYANSDFWTMPSFRCVVRSLSIGYTLPKTLLSKVNISNAKFILSGYNLWDLYNPYPGKYRNMYDGPEVGYPTLRTWSLGINIGF